MQYQLSFGFSAEAKVADLTSIALVRSYLGRDYKGTDDNLLENVFIPAASEWFLNESNRPGLVAPFTDTFDGTGAPRRTLRASPVISVESVLVDGTPVLPRAQVGEAGYVVDGDQVILVGSVFTPGVRNCAVQYVAGWVTVPRSVQLAVTELAIYLYREKDRVGVFSRSGESGSVQYQVLSLPVSVQRIIDQHRVPPEH